MTLKFLSTLVLLLGFTSYTYANDASYFGRGATVFAYKEHRVRMVSEHIKIRQVSDKKLGQTDWFADCTFVFENLQDSPLTIQMGFPDSKAHPHDHYTIADFKAWVDGAAVPATHKTVHPKRSYAIGGMGLNKNKTIPAPKPVKVDPELAAWRAMAKESMKVMDLGFSAAYTWSVAFKAKGRVVVKNTYRFGGASTNGPINLCIDHAKPDPDKPDWYAAEIWGEWGFGFGSGPCATLPYVVTTGKTWHGTIGEAIIEFEIPDTIAPVHVIPMPQATRVTDKKVIWHFKDFVPTQELHLLLAYSVDFGNEHNQDAYVHFSTLESLEKWIQFGALNGFKKSAYAKMRDIQTYGLGLRTADKKAPAVYNKWCPPHVKTIRKRNELTPKEEAILKRLEDAAK